MTKAKVILIVAFLLVFAAGVSLGMFLGRSSQTPREHLQWAQELNLTADQETKIQRILSDSQATFRSLGDRRGELAKKRDQGVQALLTDQLRAKYDAIQQEYDRAGGELGKEFGDRRAELARKRDQDILKLLPQDKQAKYTAIQQEYASNTDALSQERKKAFEDVIERTKKELNPEQIAKYDELKKQREHRSGGMRGSRRRSGATTSSAPASAPATSANSASQRGE